MSVSPTMDVDEDMSGSEPSNWSTRSVSTQSTSKRKRPLCMRCYRHGVFVHNKDHKRYCYYQFCKCVKCHITLMQREVQALQTAQKRAQDLDRRKILQPMEVKPLPFETDILLRNQSKKQKPTRKRRISGKNIEILLRYSLDQLNNFSFAEPFSFSSALLRIILEYADHSKEDLEEATVRIAKVISEMVKIRWPHYSIMASSVETPTYEKLLYPISIGIPQDSCQPITKPPNTPALSTPPCPDNPPPETSPAPSYHW